MTAPVPALSTSPSLSSFEIRASGSDQVDYHSERLGILLGASREDLLVYQTTTEQEFATVYKRYADKESRMLRAFALERSSYQREIEELKRQLRERDSRDDEDRAGEAGPSKRSGGGRRR